LSREFLFGVLVKHISEFGQGWKGLVEPYDVPQDKKQYKNNPYTGDSSIFEIGCYFYFRIDVWLFKNKPELREDLGRFLYNKFIILFSEALSFSPQTVEDLLQERITKYSELLRNKEDLDTFYFYLCELIKRTKYNARPKKANFENFQLSLGAINGWELKVHIEEKEKHMFPNAIWCIEKYLQMIS
jgi:hypothetical protein